MKTQTATNPGQLRIDQGPNIGRDFWIVGPKLTFALTTHATQAQCEYVVNAVNSHESLLAALESIAESWSADFANEQDYCRAVRKIAGDAYRNAIQKDTGGKAQ